MLPGDKPWMPTLFVCAAQTQTSLTAVLQEFRTLDKDLPVFNIKTLECQVDESVAQDRLGVMAYTWLAGQREIGIRTALALVRPVYGG